MYPASSSLRACTLRLPSVVFIKFFRSLKVSDSLAASALIIPRRRRSWIKRSRLGAALFSLAGDACVLGTSATGFWGTVFFAVECLATVFPHNNCTKNQVQAAETGSHKPITKLGSEKCDGAQRHQADSHDRNDFNGVHAAGDYPGTVKQQQHAGDRVGHRDLDEQDCQESAGNHWRRQAEDRLSRRAGTQRHFYRARFSVHRPAGDKK